MHVIGHRLKWLDDLGIKAVIATSDDSKTAQTNIKKFKKYYHYRDEKAVDVLVTVAMAYERHCAVCKPIHYRNVTTRYSVKRRTLR